MGKLLVKMILVLIALVSWVVYTKMDTIKQYINEFETPSMSAGFSLSPTLIKPVEVYKWQDTQGEWHFSSKKPQGVPDPELKTYGDSTP